MAVTHKSLETGNIHEVYAWSSSGAPTTVAADVGKVWHDSDDNTLWLCTGAGTPGTFKRISFQNDGTDCTIPENLIVTGTLDVNGGSITGGKKSVSIYAVNATSDLSASDGIAYMVIPAELNNAVLSAAQAVVITAGATGSTTIDIYNVTKTQDMLSTALTISDTGTKDTGTYAINAAQDDVSTDDVIRIDVTTVTTTAPKGLVVTLTFTDE